ncbi:MAG: hypothetical protein H5T64_06945 [Chloroflexi bacterium]|nr:hypothetical protein [Chloroflexota bacterium]
MSTLGIRGSTTAAERRAAVQLPLNDVAFAVSGHPDHRVSRLLALGLNGSIMEARSLL